MSTTLDFLNSIEAPTAQIVNLSIDLIEPDPEQPRTQFQPVDGQIDPEVMQELSELADDIYENSLLQPITVREVDGRYRIVMGERRWRAVKLNRDNGRPNSEEIATIIRQDLAQERLRLSQLAENIQRSNLTDLETAVFLKTTIEQYPELQKQDLAKVVKKSPQYVSRLLALLEPEWEHVVSTGIITYASLLEQFRPLPKEAQDQLVARAKAEGRSLTSGDIRAAKASAANDSASKSSAPKAEVAAPATPRRPVDIDPALAAAVQAFVEEQAPQNESYTPSSKAKDVPKPGPQIVDTGGDAVIPSGTTVLGAVAHEKREAKLTVAQLETLLKRKALPNKSHVVSLMLPVEDMKKAIMAMGGTLPQDDSSLPTILAEAINRA
ncbi:Nucleoid occlusion protein [Cupriavidus campinensis]|uniref:ParB/RepB/Spo0J family partition protein n=1 Tax=Cupriavidus campinensis TaxID=151783 RepID=A0ABY3EJF5_9BURK|nr:ParB/RepB/Spo0J family partition protein [Cupriavidus campinensis]TSP10984.1 ParB/RepB/Spo0J family partition protein [Cupriavidus campinensis]CAG2138397.1 Nucleoid occlusion protein [Cupriavidus campinensis]